MTPSPPDLAATPTPKNIVMIGPFPRDPHVIRGGVQASVYGLSHALAKRSDIAGLKIFSLPEKDMQEPVHTAQVEGLDVTYLNAPFRMQLSSILHLPKFFPLMRSSLNNLFHIHGTGLLQTALILCLRLRGTAFVWTLHGITEKEEYHRWKAQPSAKALLRYLLYRTIERLALRCARHVIVDTPYVAEALRGRGSLEVIPQGIFQEEFLGSENTPRDENLILSLGVYSPRKGHHLSLEAMALVLKEVPQARLIIAGSTFNSDYASLLRDKARELSIVDSVQFAIDRPRAEIVAWLMQARLFTLHSQEESQGIAFCEAMAASLPIVATDIGGIPFVVEQDKQGFLVSYEDVTSQAAAIVRLLKDDELHTRMAHSAKSASARFDWRNLAQRVVDVYDRER